MTTATLFGGPRDGQMIALKPRQHVVEAIELAEPIPPAADDPDPGRPIDYRVTPYYLSRVRVPQDNPHSRYIPPVEYHYLVADHVTNCRVKAEANFLLWLTGLFGGRR